MSLKSLGHKTPFLALVLSLMLTAISACTPKDAVNLQYSPATPAVLPAPSSPRLTVVLFEDQRPNKEAIGLKRNGTYFQADALVTEWVSRSLADEIARMGQQVSYSPTSQMAQAAQPEYMVTGRVDEVWITETSSYTYQCTLRITVTLGNKKGRVFTQALSATQEKTGVPSSSLVESLLSDTLREVLGVAASKISEAAR